MLLGENSDYIKDLFGPAVQYQVPRYQRRYVWDSMNWLTLWEDILSQLGLELVEDKDNQFTIKQRDNRYDASVSAFEGRNTEHFTGLIVTRRVVSRGTLNRFEVIDGQQRLMTFQIILCIIKDICVSKGYDDLAHEAEDHIKNKDTVIRRNISESFPDPTYKFLPTEYDESAFQAVVNGTYGKSLHQVFDEVKICLDPGLVKEARSKIFHNLEDISDNILDAYDYFYEQIRVYVGESCEYDNVDNLISSIKSDFNLIQITLGSSEQPEEIFESLNATGRKLAEFDYLRNHLFLRAGKLGIHEESGEFYSDIFYNKYWNFENAYHYWNADRLETFFWAFLIAELGPEIEDGSLKAFDRYRDYRKTLTEEQKQNVEYEFNQLKCYSDSYKELSNSNSNMGRRMQFYDNLHLPRLDSLILFGRHRLKKNDSELVMICDVLESYIIRRMLCYNDFKDSYAKINDFFSKVMNKKYEFTSNSLKGFLFAEFPRNQEVIAALQTAGAKDSNLVLYILYRIEQTLRSEPLEFTGLNLCYIDLQKRFDLPLSEHSLPTWGAADAAFQQYDPKLESIGNITLRTSVIPNGWADFKFDEKQSFLKVSVAPDLILTTEINTDHSTWDITEIDKRCFKLYKYFSQIWKS